jgi:hypothetical protein
VSDEGPFVGIPGDLPGMIQESLLSHHLGYGLQSDFRIVLASGQFCGQGRVRILEVRKIDVYIVLRQLQEGFGLVTGEITDHRNLISTVSKTDDQSQKVGKEMIRRDQVDVVDPILLNQPDHLA